RAFRPGPGATPGALFSQSDSNQELPSGLSAQDAPDHSREPAGRPAAAAAAAEPFALFQQCGAGGENTGSVRRLKPGTHTPEHFLQGFPDAVGKLPVGKMPLKSADIADIPDMVADPVGIRVGVGKLVAGDFFAVADS